jgi:hypothetical protein
MEELPLCVNSFGSFAKQNSTIRSKRQVWNEGAANAAAHYRDSPIVAYK